MLKYVFPNTLNFDHTRLLLLRVDVRHIICTKLCSILYKTLVQMHKLDKSLLSDDNMMKFKSDILNIIVDDKGNSKWTKNLKNLSIQMINKLFGNLDSQKIDFAYNWLLKQTQPSSKVYSILESKLFEKIQSHLAMKDTYTNNNDTTINDELIVNVELNDVIERLTQLIDFNYQVFGDLYTSYLN